MGADEPLWFGVLGPFEVRVGETAVDLIRAQTRALLAFLALSPNRSFSPGQLTEAMWAGAEPATATSQIHNAMSIVRRKLREAADKEVIVRDPAGYRLAVPDDATDLGLFHSLVHESRAQSGRESAETLRRALGLWRGRPLAGLNGAFVEHQRAGLDQLQGDAWEALFEVELELGRHQEIAAELTSVLAEHPLRQKLGGQLMLALYRSGRQPDALEVFRTLRAKLAEEVGTEPRPELERLHQQILSSDARLSSVSPGTQRRYLPRDLPDFVGRDSELRELDEIVARSTTAAVVISALSGAGGIGKTALAVRWAHRIGSRYPDGHLYVNLRGYDQRSPMPAQSALSTLLKSLGVAAENIPAEADESEALYRSTTAGRRLLVVLDNARTAEHVRPLLPTGKGSLAVITSRDNLAGLVARDGARLLTLDALPDDQAVELIETVLGTERVVREREAAAQLATLCGGLPLALRIAAANLVTEPTLPIAAAVARLRDADRIDHLAVADDADSAVRTVFDQSYASLEPEDRRVFRLIGLHPGPDITAEAVAALAGIAEADAVAALHRLTQASLASQAAPGRFQLHDLVKLYAARRVGPSEMEPARARLFRFYLAAAASATIVVSPHAIHATDFTGRHPAHTDTASAAAWLDAEQHNLATIVYHAAEHGPAEYAWRLADVLRGYYWIGRDVAAWKATAEAGMAAAVAEDSVRGRAAMHLSLGNAVRVAGRMDEAFPHFTEALRLAREEGWADGEAAASGCLGVVHTERGEKEAAIACFERGADLSRRAGRTASMAVHLSNIGALRLRMGELREAAAVMASALELLHATGNRIAAAIMIGNLGLLDLDLGRFDEAERLLKEGIGIHQDTADRSNEATALSGLADLYLRTGRLDEAERYCRRAYSIAEAIDSPRHRALLLVTLAHVDRLRGRLAEAYAQAEDALAIARECGQRYTEADALDAIGQIRLSQGDRATARDRAVEALALAEADGYQVMVAKALTTLAETHLASGETGDAERRAREALEICERTGIQQCAARATSVLSRSGTG